MKPLFVIVPLVLLSACATAINTPYQRVPVTSEPAGAYVIVDCGAVPHDGGVTPATVRLDRAAEHCSITLSKEGYEPHSIAFERQPSRVARANAAIGGAAGVFTSVFAMLVTDDFDDLVNAYEAGRELGDGIANSVDQKSGAAWKQVPSKVAITLQPSSY